MMKIGRRGWWAAGLLCLAGLGAAPAEDTRVADAAMRADRAAVRALVAQGASVTAAQADGTTALHWAARTDDVATAQLLLKSGAKVDVSTRYGVTPLYLASVNGSAAMIGALLGAGANPNAANPGGETALMTAARTGRIDAVTLLLDRGAAVDAKENVRGQTALMWAVLENHQDIVRLLLARGADVNAQTKIDIPDGTTGEPQATSGDIGAHGPGIYRSRAVPSPTGAMTPLLYSAREGNLPMTRILLDAHADIDRPAANGTSPLVVAITNNHIELALFLVEKGADVNAADRFYKRGPLFAAVERRNPDFTRDSAPPAEDPRDPMDLIKVLLQRGANPNWRTNTTPFRGFYQVSANWANFDGQTPFLRAALSGDVTLMRLLLEHGADPNIKTNDGATPLMAAAGVNWVVAQTYSRSEAEYLEAARLCLERGNDVNAVNSQGFAAIHGAANRGFDAMIELLAAAGAKLDVKDKQGRTPMTFAEGVFLAVQPPVNKPSTIALLKKLTNQP
ncbi:MAG TPA: ankyrin repeat domain-containing protein [Vicinamibacterales bacterium]|nr:ankyrin repeat domain-containing protein [Vicinamibacterales bacterium]